MTNQPSTILQESPQPLLRQWLMRCLPPTLVGSVWLSFITLIVFSLGGLSNPKIRSNYEPDQFIAYKPPTPTSFQATNIPTRTVLGVRLPQWSSTADKTVTPKPIKIAKTTQPVKPVLKSSVKATQPVLTPSITIRQPKVEPVALPSVIAEAPINPKVASSPLQRLSSNPQNKPSLTTLLWLLLVFSSCGATSYILTASFREFLRGTNFAEIRFPTWNRRIVMMMLEKIAEPLQELALIFDHPVPTPAVVYEGTESIVPPVFTSVDFPEVTPSPIKIETVFEPELAIVEEELVLEEESIVEEELVKQETENIEPFVYTPVPLAVYNSTTPVLHKTHQESSVEKSPDLPPLPRQHPSYSPAIPARPSEVLFADRNRSTISSDKLQWVSNLSVKEHETISSLLVSSKLDRRRLSRKPLNEDYRQSA